MQLIGFNFDKVNIERKGALKGKLQVNSNINVKNITQEKVDLIKDRLPFKFEFEFSVKYSPEVAEVILHGALIALLEKEESKDLLKKWKDKKHIDDSVRIPILNMILSKCNLKALVLEEEMNLPLHMPMPRVTPQSDKSQNYAG